ncbi:MAG: FixH family protein, partial [Limisphaerales bacterium]
MNSEKSAPPRPPLNPWPVSIIAFFTMAILGCASFTAFCSRHPADLVTADCYEQEIRYQSRIDDAQRARQRAQATKVTYDGRTRLISITLPHLDSKSRVVGKVQLYRPSAVNLDRELPLEPRADGIKTIDARDLLP